MKKILIIHHSGLTGGGLIALLGLIAELKKENTVTVLCLFDGPAINYILKSGVKVIRPEACFYRRYYTIFVHSEVYYYNLIDEIKKIKAMILYFLNMFLFAPRYLKTIAKDEDIIYLNSTFLSDWAYAGYRLKKKVVIHIREPLAKGFLGLRMKILQIVIHKFTNKVIAISKDNLVRVNASGKSSVIYDPVLTTGRSETKPIVVDSSLKYFIYLGGSQRIKGFEQLTESLRYLKEDIRIFFLGGISHYNNHGFKHLARQLFDPYSRKFKSLVRTLTDSKNIINIGETDAVFSYFEKSIALICPYSKPHAALPILESFSLRKPVIVSDIKGMEELVDGKNGVFFRNNDPRSLADRINELSLLTKEEYNLMQVACESEYQKIRDRKDSVLSVIEEL